MITIDNDRSWIGLIRQKQNQPDVPEGKMANLEGAIRQGGDTQLIDLLSLVKQSPEMSIATERLQQIRNAIHADTYSIDLDSLVENILVSDHG